MTDHFQSVSMMIEDLRSDDPESRLSSMRGLHCIAQTLGPERVRSELLPYIMDYLDDDDEVLRTLASTLGTMLAEVGGPSFVEALFSPLETLCGLDEISVREEAIQSLVLLSRAIFSADSLSSQQTLYMGMVTRLSKNPEPRARASAAGLIGFPYETGTPAQKKELKAKYMTLCSDEEVLVRRAACGALSKSVAQAFGATCNDLVQTFVTLCKDPNDSIRLQACQSATALLAQLKDSNVTQVFGALKTLSSDPSWRVRYMFADTFPKLCDTLPKKELKSCTAIFKSIVQDVEAEIRASMIFALDALLRNLTDDTSKKDVLIAGCRLSSDPNVHVRTSLATSILKSTTHINKEQAMNHVTPCCNELLQDFEADVRLALLGGFSEITNNSGGAEVAQIIAPKLLGPIMSSAENKDIKWRVRETVVRQAPHIIPFLSQENATQLASVCLEGLIDRVATIRAAAAEGCARLVERNGVDWARTALLPRLRNMADTPSFLPRLTFLQVAQKLIVIVDSNFATKELLPTVTKLAADPVPNVRIHVAKTLLAAKNARHLSSGEFDSLMVKFNVDKDPDVRDAAKKHQ